MTPKKGWVVPPVNGLLEPVKSPTPHPAREAMGLLWHIPQQEQRKPKRNSKAIQVENHWKPEHDLPPEVLKAFEKKEKRK